MTWLITVADDPVLPAATPPAQPGIPELDEDGRPIDWSYRQAAGLRFARWRRERGDFDGDRFGLRPEPMPPIVRRIEI